MEFFYNKYNGNLQKMSREETSFLRSELLKINGFGEETVDSILLYACDKPIFVVDAYTKRIFSRFGIISEKARYGEVQNFFMMVLPKKTELYNDFHAQIVHLGNEICKTKPDCKICPILKINNKIYCQYGNKNE